MSAGTNTPALEVDQLTKRFGRTVALDAVTLSVGQAEIHALLGHNGSGKSTLVKLLSGYHQPDSGTIRFSGTQLEHPITKDRLLELGVGFVHQDIGLVPGASVTENLLISRFTTGMLGNIRWQSDRRRIRGLLQSFGLNFDPETQVGRLSAAQRTLVGLVRAFQDLEGHQNGLLVLDEVTASLPAQELERVFEAIREIRARGTAVLIVTHHLNEPLLLADRVSALRDGKLVASEQIDGQSERDLAEMVTGEQRHEVTRKHRPAPGEVMLKVSSVSGKVANNISFQVRRGEILGITGLEGSGHDEIPYLLYGAHGGTADFVIDGHQITKPRPDICQQQRIAMVSGDRSTSGGVLPATLAENLSAPVIALKQSSGMGPRTADEKSLVSGLIERFDIKPTEPSLVFSALSGGNQQKALLGRWMAQPPKLLLLHEPTAGVDIGAVDSILTTLEEYVSQGGAILLSSTQYEDLSRVADRVLVFSQGQVLEEVTGNDITPHNLLTKSYASPSQTAEAA
jgi:ribose transport system ATP-binding protein